MVDLGGKRALFLVGPTASGKGALALALARSYPVRLAAMDSMKVYRGMDVGTAKPSSSIGVPVMLVDMADPSEEFDLASWIRAAEAAILETSASGLLPLFCGGTGLYLKGLLSGVFAGPPAQPHLRQAYAAEAERSGPEFLHDRLAVLDPKAAAGIGRRDLKRIMRALEVIEVTGLPVSSARTQFSGRRPDLSARLVGIERETADLYARADRRIEAMVAAGFPREAAHVMGEGTSKSASQALGYSEMAAYARGEMGLDEALVLLKRRTRVFIRRQKAWFRKFPDIEWIRVEGPSDSPVVMERAAAALGLA